MHALGPFNIGRQPQVIDSSVHYVQRFEFQKVSSAEPRWSQSFTLLPSASGLRFPDSFHRPRIRHVSTTGQGENELDAKVRTFLIVDTRT
jgi:hypothetical protein